MAAPAPRVHKLMTASMELAVEEVHQHLSDATDFTVIGVLGSQGVGKSTVMSLLAGADWSHSGAAGSELCEPPFAPQGAQCLLGARHQTCGVDLLVTSERVLLLDTQPLFSPSVLLDLQRDAGLPAEAQTHENLLELHSLRLAMLLLSTCHLVIVASDSLLDAGAMRSLRTAQMLRHRLPDVSTVAPSAGGGGGGTSTGAAAVSASTPTASSAVAAGASSDDAVVEYDPQLAFVYSRQPPSAMATSQRRRLRTLLSALFPSTARASTSHSLIAGTPAGALASGDRGVGVPATSPAAEAQQPAVGGPLVFLLPDSEDGASICESHEGYRAEAERMRDELLALPRRPFARPLSEKEWLRGLARVWELLKRSAPLAEYNRAQQKLHAYS